MPVGIQVEGLIKKHPGYALWIPQLEIPSGVVALVGESGAGKSTLLDLLGGLDLRYDGTIRFRGDVMPRSEDLDTLRRNQFSFLFQQSNLLANFPVRDNVLLSRKLSGGETADPDAILSRLFPASRSGLGRRFPSELSGGERQRVAVARSLVKAEDGATAFFADEPTANIDRRSADECFEMLREWQRRHPSSLLVCATHDPILARRCDHIVMLGEVRDDDRAHLPPAPSFGGSTTPTALFTAVHHGPIAETWPAIERRLLGVSEPTAIAAPIAPATPTDESESRAPRPKPPPRWGFLWTYFRRDSFRKRELLDTFTRIAVISFLFFWIAFSASLHRGVPRAAEHVFSQDPLLRLVEIESAGSFPIGPDKRNEILQQLPPSEADTDVAHASSSPLAAVQPHRSLSFKFYRADGQLSLRWHDGSRIVYPEDSLIGFWGLPLIDPEGGLVVRGDLLVDLGFNLDEFAGWIAAGDHRAALAVDEFQRVELPVSAIVRDIPDPYIDVLIPSDLARRVKTGELRAAVYRSVSFKTFATMGEARKLERPLRDALALAEMETRLFVEPAPEHRPGAANFQIRIQTRDPAGWPESDWLEVQAIFEGIASGEAGLVSVPPMEPGTPVFSENHRTREFDASDSHLATVFVRDWRDVPRTIDWLEEHSKELQIKVSNPESRESIRTVDSSYRLGVLVMAVVTAVFLIVSTVCIAYSFVPQLHRKSGEIGILRTYGASRFIVLARFLLESAVTCAAGMFVGTALFAWFALPHLNDWAGARAGDLLAKYPGDLLSFESVALALGLGAIVLCVLAVGMVAAVRIRQSPAQLTRMST